jgi:hypothetical protein
MTENVILRAERVVDKVQSQEFFPFIAIEKFTEFDNNKDSVLPFKNIYFVSFAIQTMEIT